MSARLFQLEQIIEKVFASLDTNHDGKCSRSEVSQYVRRSQRWPEVGEEGIELVLKMIFEFDSDNDGFISFEEYKKATFHEQIDPNLDSAEWSKAIESYLAGLNEKEFQKWVDYCSGP